MTRLAALVCTLLLTACTIAPPRSVDAPVTDRAPTATPVPSVPPKPIVVPAPKIAIALGSGAARGFAHVGVLKMLDAQGIRPDIVVGTSAGSVVGALYAAGISPFEIQKRALELDEGAVRDLTLPNRGFLKGEKLQGWINDAVGNRPIEKLDRLLAVVATDLQTGEPVVFRRGNTGQAVRASSSVPGVFQPVSIGGRDHVDGGVTIPVPVRVARDLGADIVIAVDIGKHPDTSRTRDTIDVLLQTFTIMGWRLSRQELALADVVITPDTRDLRSASFESRNTAILEGEKAALAAMPKLREKLAEREARVRRALEAAAATR
ncbi:MAG: patatin-like phospholipase family protein [Burkholderiales bacterium]|nr:patatin-like phospholipase family protein [Burkholderiales bacterium]